MIGALRWLFLLFAAWNLATGLWGDTADPELRFWTALAFLGLSYLALRLNRRTA